jgi:hypothetical protein
VFQIFGNEGCTTAPSEFLMAPQVGLTGRAAHQRAQDHDVREEGKKVQEDSPEWTRKHDNNEQGEYM